MNIKNNSARIKYLASVLEETFQVFQQEALEIFQGPRYADLWDNWMQGKGSAHIFVYYQKPGRFMAETGEWEEAKNAQKEFVVSEGEAKLRGKGMFFLRLTPPGKPITPTNQSDNEVMLGEVHENTHNVLNTVITTVYSRFIDKLEGNDWGDCEPEAKKEFNMTFNKFSEEVKEAIKSLQQPLNLTAFPSNLTKDAQDFVAEKSIAKDKVQGMVDKFEEIFNSWY